MCFKPPGLHYEVYEPTNSVPPELQGQSRFVGTKGQALPREHGPRCVLRPHNLLNVLIDIEAGLREAQRYTNGLAKEYADYFGNVGVNADVQVINSAAATCWDWGELCHRRPMVHEVRAYCTLAEKLLPLLELGEKPPETIHPHAQGPWPAIPLLAAQYLLLCKRVRVREAKEHCFSRVVNAQVTTLFFRPKAADAGDVVYRWIGQLRSQRFGNLVLPAYLVAACLVGDGSQPGSFQVDLDSLCLPGAYESCKYRKDNRPGNNSRRQKQLYHVSPEKNTLRSDVGEAIGWPSCTDRFFHAKS